MFPDVLAIPLSIDGLVMVLLGGLETMSGAVVGAIAYKALAIWLMSETDLSKLVLGSIIVVCVVVLPRGIVGTLEALGWRLPPFGAPSPLEPADVDALRR